MDLTVVEVRGLAPAGTEKMGNPDFRQLTLPESVDSPFRARSEITAPMEDRVAPAIFFAAARTESSIFSVVLILEITAIDGMMSRRGRFRALHFLDRPFRDGQALGRAVADGHG